jgi:RNA polymerase sigma-70 factor, ECF subfamily
MSADALEAARPRLMAIAYRMLGSRAEAEDVVGDVALRWTAADRESIANPEAWLVTVTTRRALDVLRSARLQREAYPGVWLPEPIVTGGGPDDEIERVESLTMGFLVLLERLTPIERAVFVLHDALDYPYDEIAEAVGRSEDSCRQALHRARRRITVPHRRSSAERHEAESVAHRFLATMSGGGVEELLATLSPGIVVTSDGGGIVHAAMRPVSGQQRVARYLRNLAARLGSDPLVVPCEMNGEPAVVAHGADGWAAVMVTVDDGLVTAMHVVVSPPKLERLLATFGDLTSGRPGPWETEGRFRNRGGQPVTTVSPPG